MWALLLDKINENRLNKQIIWTNNLCSVAVQP